MDSYNTHLTNKRILIKLCKKIQLQKNKINTQKVKILILTSCK